MNLLIKKCIVITGAGSGLGKMAALELAKRGHKVIATALYETQVIELNNIAKEKNLDLESFKLDITNEKDRNKLLDYEFDTLINNAAIGESGSIAEIPIDRFINVFNTNVFSNILITQIAIQKFAKKGYGRIIFLSSLLGKKAVPFLGPYCSSKFAIEGFVEALRYEMKILKNCTIEITIIEPGAFATGFNKENNEKMYTWMGEKSLFRNQISSIHTIQEKLWNIIESKNYHIIIKKYIKAVEDKHVKSKYSAPFLQSIFIKILNILK